MTAEWSKECVPNGYEPVPHQVAGHMYKDGKHGILRECGAANGQLLKPVQCPPKGQREVDFYEAVNSTPISKSAWKEFAKWMPRFSGIATLSDHQQYIVLEDLVAPYDNPSIMDIKMGKRCWDYNASEEKIRRETDKYPPQATLGYRIGGTKEFDKAKQGYRERNKVECLKLDAQEVLVSLTEFFAGRGDALHDVLQQLTQLLRLFETQSSVHFFSSSLLFIYGSSMTKTEPRACVRLIDFAHAYVLSEDEATVDENYLFGLRNLIESLSGLQ